jgi:hypothetical protein
MKLYWLAIAIFILLITPTSAGVRLTQGENVYLNETIDVSSVSGWADSISYYGGWSNDGDPEYVIELPYGTKRYDFYIDPEIFSNRLGYWYQYYGRDYSDDHGFTTAFKVVNGARNVSTRYENGSINFDVEYDIGNHTPTFVSPPVSIKHVSDYLVARGNDLFIKTGSTARVWVFGEKDSLYNLKSFNNSVYINNTTIQNLRVGEYKIIVHTTGGDSEFNVLYNPIKKVLSSLYSTQDSFEMKEFDITSLSQSLFRDKLLEEINKTSDEYKIYNLVIEDPMVDIIAQDEVDVSQIKLLQVKGYTNVAANTNLCFGIDEKIKYKSVDYKPSCVLAQETSIDSPGDMRYFLVSIPFSYNDLSVGTHFITGSTAIGGSMTTSFYVYETFDDKPRNSSLKYIDGNLFVPTPTPEIIKVIETQIIRQVVTQVVEVQLTPNLQQLYDTQKKINDDKIIEYTTYGLIGVCIIAAVYLLYVLIRAMRRKE